MKDKTVKEIMGFGCATVLGSILLIMDGTVASAVALGLIGAFTGIGGFAVGKVNNNR